MLKKGQRIGKYEIVTPLGEVPRVAAKVRNPNGEICFLRLLEEPETLSRLRDKTKPHRHRNIAAYIEDFETVLEGRTYFALVLEYIRGVTLADYLEENGNLSVYEARCILRPILETLTYLHSQPRPVILRGLNPEAVMLDRSFGQITPKITDMGFALFLDEQDPGTVFKSPFYAAPECLWKTHRVESDIFSAAALFYSLVFHLPPWFTDLPEESQIPDYLNAYRRTPLKFDREAVYEWDDELEKCLAKALAPDAEKRFHSAAEFLEELSKERVWQAPAADSAVPVKKAGQSAAKTGKGGFRDVAGMTELKKQLQNDVIDVLQDTERAAELGLHLPNGLLFYGPPGCGKTYFAEKFAEEAGCNYIYIRCSDIASPYIHGGQGKIAEVFNEARKSAPTILFFDEIEAMIRDRSMQTNTSEAGEVNEFLSQLNDIGKSRVIVVGATNRPDLIDPAALRAGRLEYKYFIPMPDKETRTALFKVNLRDRKADEAIDFELLAEKTDGYVASDITLIVNKAARLAFREHAPAITQEHLEKSLADTKPSLSEENRGRYEKLDSSAPSHRTNRIGFY
jgi:transitional endoplasmic reticulum ATPase